MRVLVAEDDPMLGPGMRRALQRAGYTVDLAITGEEADAALLAQRYAMVLLDVGLPELSGLQVLKALRTRKDATRVIIVTARDRPEQKVEGLDGGADDYVVKPFDLEELLARIRAQLRRGDQRVIDILTAGDVALDLMARVVTQQDAPVNVTAKEFKVLATLMRRSGQFVGKQELEDALYDDSADVESNTIETAIYGLRRKLGAQFIVTARGLGYMAPRDR